jgi:hypothetical protein
MPWNESQGFVPARAAGDDVGFNGGKEADEYDELARRGIRCGCW